MNKLEELIQELCPNGVKYRTVGDICNICRGVVISKDFIRDNVGAYPVYSSQTENNGELGKINTYSFDGEYLTWTTDGANAGSVFYRNGKFSVTNVCGVLEMKDNNISAKFLFYVLQTSVKPYVNKGMGNPKLMSNVMARVKVPVPPIEVQEEIVRILDKFTELTAELTARKKQYEFYRDQLLSFNSINDTTNNRTGGGYNHLLNCQVKWVRLGNIATITRGGNFQKKDFCSDGVACIHYGQIYTKYDLYTNRTFTFIPKNVADKSKKAVPNDIVMAVTSENIEDVCKCVAWLGNEDIAVSGHTAIIHHNQNAKYLSYFFHTKMFFEQKRKYAHGTKVIEVTPNKLEDIIIPIPSLENQASIVDILDKFHSLVTDISEGLPAEIEARQKQYEYYRDKLLTFEEIAQ